MLLENLLGDKAHGTGPVLGSVVEHVVDLDVVVLGGNGVQLLLEQNVVVVHVGVDEVNLGVVGGIGGNVSQNLVHGGDAGSSTNHAEGLDQAVVVDKVALGAPHLHSVTNGQLRHVLGDVSLGVGLDENVEVALVVQVGRGGGVGTQHLLASNVGRKRHVLSDGQTQHVGGSGQAKSIDGRIVREHRLLDERELLEGRISSLQDSLGLGVREEVVGGGANDERPHGGDGVIGLHLRLS